jgi:hypothetical protein
MARQVGGLLDAFLDSGLRLERFEELVEGFGIGNEEKERRFALVPGLVAVVARKV